MDKSIHKVVRRLDYSLSEMEIESLTSEYLEKIENGNFDFSSYNSDVFTQNKKKRKIISYDKMSIENVICHYLKKRLDSTFKIKYASRSKIINLLFNTLPVIKDLNDFVIVRADFKSFFDSVYTNHVYEKYIKNSLLTRKDKELLEDYCDKFKYCYAGMCLSNGMTEIVCRDFDKQIRAKLERYGVVLYERYVDDILIILNSYLNRDKFLEIVDEVIKDVFEECPVKLNVSPDKFSHIPRRNIQPIQEFNFLGYEFFVKFINDKFKFEFGITEKKRNKYMNIIEQAFIDFKKYGNEELFRQRLKIYSSRIVVARSLGENNFEWLTKGITANYNELQFHMHDLENDTLVFLKNLYFTLMTKHHISPPYFLVNSNNESSIYNLFSSLERNRSIVFEKNIGVKRKDLISWIKKIDSSYSNANKNYYQIVIEFLEMLKVE